MKCNKSAPDVHGSRRWRPQQLITCLTLTCSTTGKPNSCISPRLAVSIEGKAHAQDTAIFQSRATAEPAKNHVGYRTVNSNQQLVNDVQYNTFTSPCFLFRRSKKACHNQGRAHHATTLRAVSSGLRPRTTESNTRMSMGHSSSHDTPHLPRGLLRSSLHSRGCKPTTTETPTLFHPGRHGGNTQCSCCCRCHDILAPRRYLTRSSKCLNTFPTIALRPRKYHFKRASRSEGRHAVHKKRFHPQATQGCTHAEAKKQRNAIALIACALPRSTKKPELLV